jgi:hypothetical protein
MRRTMNEILPGLWHWSAHHPPIGLPVSSYFVEPARAVLDPKIPEEGLDAAFADRPRPEQVVLTSGHHLRDSRAFAETFGIPIRASRGAIEHLGDEGEGIEPFEDGDVVAPGMTAIHVGVLAPDEGALHVTGVGDGALALADAAHLYGDDPGFFRDSLLGDDPEQVKQGLKDQLRALLELDFDALLFAHGDPIPRGGKAALREFAAS